MFDLIIIFICLAAIVFIIKTNPGSSKKRQPHPPGAVFVIKGFCATGDPCDESDLFPGAEAKLETTTSEDIIYIGVNPLTTGSTMSGMYIRTKELEQAVLKLTQSAPKYPRLDAT